MVAARGESGPAPEASHPGVVRGQHEIARRHANPPPTADNLATLRFVVRNIALRHGLVATFMPKPLYGANGSGMHTHQALFAKEGGGGGGRNAFHDAAGARQLSEGGRGVDGGVRVARLGGSAGGH